MNRSESIPDVMHPRPLSRQARKQETHDAIIRAAATLFAQQGYGATSLEQIAAHIGLSRGAVYGHFKNKRDLVDAVIRTTTIGLDETPFTELDLDPRERMRRLAEAFLAISRRVTMEQVLLDSELFLYDVRDQGRGATTAAEQRDAHAAYAAALEATLAARGEQLSVPAEEFVALVFGVARGLLHENVRLPGAISQTTVERAFDGLTALISRRPVGH